MHPTDKHMSKSYLQDFQGRKISEDSLRQGGKLVVMQGPADVE